MGAQIVCFCCTTPTIRSSSCEFVDGKQYVGVFVQEDGIVVDTRLGQQRLEFGPYFVVTSLVFLGTTFFQLHFEGHTSCRGRRRHDG